MCLAASTTQAILESIADEIQRKNSEHEGDAGISGEMRRHEEKLATFVQH